MYAFILTAHCLQLERESTLISSHGMYGGWLDGVREALGVNMLGGDGFLGGALHGEESL